MANRRGHASITVAVAVDVAISVFSDVFCVSDAKGFSLVIDAVAAVIVVVVVVVVHIITVTVMVVVLLLLLSCLPLVVAAAHFNGKKLNFN